MSSANVIAIVDQYAEKISASWKRSVEAFFETGRLLIEAKERIERGQFQLLVKNKLPFDPRTAERYMAIAANPRLADAAREGLVPSSATTLYMMTRLPPQVLDAKLKDGTINPSSERDDIEKLVRASAPINGGRAIAAARVEPDDSDNFFPTPPWATRALFAHVFPHLGINEFGSVWEPACGEGHMAEVLHEYFAQVGATDINDYGYNEAQCVDFLSDRRRIDVEWIITNPPFGDLTIPFVQKARERARIGTAMFVRSQWIVEGVERYEEIFRDYPPTLCAFFTERVPLWKGRWNPTGSTMTAYCWLVWLRDVASVAPFWIPPGCREELSLPDDVARFTQHPVQPRDVMEAAE